MTEDYCKKTVAICDTEPISVEGLRSLLARSPDLEFLDSFDSLEAAIALIDARSPDIVVLDKSMGMLLVMDWIHHLKLAHSSLAVIVWGGSMTESESLNLFIAGIRGIVLKTGDLARLMKCLRTVASGRSWLDDCVFQRSPVPSNAELTAREQQVLSLVERALKNKQIALELGIRPGTVKIHLKHIFEKTGVRGRYELAISRLSQRDGLSMVSDGLGEAKLLSWKSRKIM